MVDRSATYQEIRYRGGAPLALAVAVAMVLLTGLAIWFGYLDVGRPHPTLKLGLSMLITVWGLGAILLVRLVQAHDGRPVADVLRTVIGLLLVTAAVIHFAVVRQHFLEYWLYGWFFVVAGVGQLIGGLLVVVRPRRGVFLGALWGDPLPLVRPWGPPPNDRRSGRWMEPRGGVAGTRGSPSRTGPPPSGTSTLRSKA